MKTMQMLVLSLEVVQQLIGQEVSNSVPLSLVALLLLVYC